MTKRKQYLHIRTKVPAQNVSKVFFKWHFITFNTCTWWKKKDVCTIEQKYQLKQMANYFYNEKVSKDLFHLNLQSGTHYKFKQEPPGGLTLT